MLKKIFNKKLNRNYCIKNYNVTYKPKNDISGTKIFSLFTLFIVAYYVERTKELKDVNITLDTDEEK